MMSRPIRMLAVLPILLMAAGAGAEVPPTINYQGVLTDEYGTPLDGTYELTFEIYPDADMSGIPLWREDFPDGVPVIDGVFSVVLGGITPLPVDLFEENERWLAVTVEGGDPIEPLVRLTSVPFAMRASVADSLAGGGSGGGGWTIADPHVLLAMPGNVGFGTPDPERKLQIGDAAIPDAEGMIRLESRSGTQGSHRRWDAGVPETDGDSSGIGYSFILDDLDAGAGPEFMVKWGTGNVGIGTIDPQEKLDVAGAIRTEGFVMPSGAGVGWVLTSDNDGVGTWQPAGGSTGDGDWMIDGDDMYAANSGNVGVGVTSPAAKLDVAGEGLVVRAFSNGNRAGVYGKHVGSGNYGYVGSSGAGLSGMSEGFPGVYGESDSVAVYGFNSGTLRTKGYLGGGYGAYGETSSGNYGYLGGASFAVYGESATNGNYGGIGYWNYAVLGDSENNTGVLGRSDGSSGVAGQTTSGWGVYGTHLSSDNYGYIAGSEYAMYAWADGASSTAFYGRNANRGNFGTIGTDDDAVYGESTSDNAIHGVSPHGNAGFFEGDVLVTGGQISAPVVQITGGSDLSERFEIRDAASGPEPQPGHLVSFDSQRPGKLIISHEAYDKKVAGVISGAGGVNPGLLMGQHDSVADGGSPVALTGRAYCWADATDGPIEPGDLLTTSDVPGHAMKAADHDRCHGTVIGKAMSSLPSGRGLVLVLVNLH